MSSSWAQDDSGYVTTPFEPIVLVATLALVPVLVVQADVETGPWATAAELANWAIWAIFVVEFVSITLKAERKKAALRAHWLDAILVIVTVPTYGAFLSSLRLIRLARLVRAGVIVARALKGERSLTSATTFRFVALITVLMVVVAGSAQATFDSHDFPSVWDGFWWAIVTVTTVGYGDLYPTTVVGRLIGVFVMLVGVGFVSVLTATIVSQFVETDTSSAEVLATLRQIENDLNELKQQVARSQTTIQANPSGLARSGNRQPAAGTKRGAQLNRDMTTRVDVRGDQ
jgi:voltage-gated potassium channel